jgi:ABC-type nitrate/sulfonate/bicarbonate transport system ATPase subunit
MSTETPAPTATRMKLEVRDLRKVFRWKSRGVDHEVEAINGLSVSARENEFLAVIGPSGCGKTTLLRILGSLEQADGGEVLIDGKQVEGPGQDRAIVFQHFGLFPWKTVIENVKFPLTVRKVPDSEATARAEHFLAMVGLSRVHDSHPHQLSGGMQQRVGLARALATDADVLLMDEPFGAIDAQTRELMQEQLLQLWTNQKKTVVFVTHDLDEAVLLADRVVVLSRGPGRVRDILDVDLPRPRWEYDVRAEDRFAHVRHQIWQMLRSDVEADAQSGV